MPELLSQDEIDALLSAVEEVAEPETEPRRAVSEEREEVVPYDFSHPQRLNREQLRTLRNMHEVVIRNFGATLGAYLRGTVECRLISVDQLTYSEFVSGLPNPTCFNIVKAEPGEGSIALEINPSIAFPLLDRLLGAGAAAGPMDRPLTDIEFRLITRVVNLVLSQLEMVWKRAGDVKLELASQESNPHLVALAPPTEMVVTVVAEVHLGDHSGLLNLCIPFTPFQGFFGRFLSVAGYAFSTADRDAARAELMRRVRDIPLQVRGILARSKAQAADVGGIQEGDVFVTERYVTEPAEMLVSGRPKFVVTEGRHRGRTAVKITGLRQESREDSLTPPADNEQAAEVFPPGRGAAEGRESPNA